MKQKALVLAGEHLLSLHGKTAHGLIRKSERFEIIGVIDPANAGKDTSELLPRVDPLPIFSSVVEAIEKLPEKPDLCITGVATHGGVIPEEIKNAFVEAIANQISIVNSLHEFISEHEELKALAEKGRVELHDIRKPKPKSELRFWSGEILKVKTPTVTVMGTDCALGKRTTTQWLLDECKKMGLRTEMIYTGQTGWLQGARYGFIFDVTPNDFVSGELEGAILQCEREQNPDLILIEGQSSLRNPAGPCGAEFLLSANSKGVILQHAPRRRYFEGLEELQLEIPSLGSEIALIDAYGAQVIAISMNSEGMEDAEVEAEKSRLSQNTGLPVFAPIQDGCSGLAEALNQWMKNRS